MPKIQCFEPIVDSTSNTLILGTAPGVSSLEKRQYYGNKNNYFWDIIFRIYSPIWGSFDYVSDQISYSEKKELLLHNHIALWDVVSECEKEGSSDKNIKSEILNDFNSFLWEYPNINKIIFNGKGSEKKSGHSLFLQKFEHLLEDMTVFKLNSTSSQNPNNPFMILNEWNKALRHKL